MKLEKDGVELVTNIKIAGDTREHVRRTEEEEASRLRKERLEQESKIATDKFEEVLFSLELFYDFSSWICGQKLLKRVTN